MLKREGRLQGGFEMLNKLVSRKHFSFTKINEIFVKRCVYNFRVGPRLWASENHLSPSPCLMWLKDEEPDSQQHADNEDTAYQARERRFLSPVSIATSRIFQFLLA